MGASASCLSSHAELLSDLAGDDSVWRRRGGGKGGGGAGGRATDAPWRCLLRPALALSSVAGASLEAAAAPFLEGIAANSPATGNLPSLLRACAAALRAAAASSSAAPLPAAEAAARAAADAAVVARVLIKLAAERLSPAAAGELCGCGDPAAGAGGGAAALDAHLSDGGDVLLLSRSSLHASRSGVGGVGVGSEHQQQQHLSQPSTPLTSLPAPDELARAALSALRRSPTRKRGGEPQSSPQQYALQLEVCQLLLALASSTLYQQREEGAGSSFSSSSSSSPLLDCLLRAPRPLIVSATAALLSHAAADAPPPAGSPVAAVAASALLDGEDAAAPAPAASAVAAASIRLLRRAAAAAASWLPRRAAEILSAASRGMTGGGAAVRDGSPSSSPSPASSWSDLSSPAARQAVRRAPLAAAAATTLLVLVHSRPPPGLLRHHSAHSAAAAAAAARRQSDLGGAEGATDPSSSSSSSSQEVSPFQSALESLIPAFEEEEGGERGGGRSGSSSGRENTAAAAVAAEAGTASASASALPACVPMRSLVAALSEGGTGGISPPASSLRSRVREKVSSNLLAVTTASAASAVCGPLLLYSLLRCSPAFREAALPEEGDSDVPSSSSSSSYSAGAGRDGGPTEASAARAAALALPLLRALYSATTPAKDDKKKATTSAAAPHSAEKDALQRQQQLYMLLVDLLLLSQEPRWSTAARGRAPRAGVALYSDALLPKNGTSVAGLAACVLLRAAHAALSAGGGSGGNGGSGGGGNSSAPPLEGNASTSTSGSDVYLLTTALAALANLTPAASPLPAHAAGRLVRLFERLDARYGRLSAAATSLSASASAAAASAATSAAVSSGSNRSNGSGNTNGSAAASRLRAAADAAAAEAGLYEDLMRISLEIISSALLHGLPCRRGGGGGGGGGRADGGCGGDPISRFDSDPLARLLPPVYPPTEPRDGTDLAYALLHRADAFARRAAHPRLGDPVAGVVACCAFFGGAVDAARGAGSGGKSLPLSSASSPSRNYFEDSLEAIGEAEAAAAVRGALATWHPSALLGGAPGGGALSSSPSPLPSDLRFSYEEEEGADAAFFSPVAWAAAVAATAAGVGWRRSAARLFDDGDEGGGREGEGVASFGPASSSRGEGGGLSAARVSASSLEDFGNTSSGRGGLREGGGGGGGVGVENAV